MCKKYAKIAVYTAVPVSHFAMYRLKSGKNRGCFGSVVYLSFRQNKRNSGRSMGVLGQISSAVCPAIMEKGGCWSMPFCRKNHACGAVFWLSLVKFSGVLSSPQGLIAY